LVALVAADAPIATMQVHFLETRQPAIAQRRVRQTSR
jgi:hypothetical protein